MNKSELFTEFSKYLIGKQTKFSVFGNLRLNRSLDDAFKLKIMTNKDDFNGIFFVFSMENKHSGTFFCTLAAQKRKASKILRSLLLFCVLSNLIYCHFK